MSSMRQAVLLGAALALLFGMAGTSSAQTATGQITGTVTDPSGAVVPQVRVTITNQETNSSREVTTNEAGTYSVPLLPVGVYTVIAEKAGFRITKQSDIHLTVAQVIRVDMQMAVGEVTQTVEVTAAAVMLDTESSAVTHLVSERQIGELPLNSRNFVQFLLLGSGAVQTNGEQGAMRQGKGNAISINGARPTSNNYTLDGMINTDVALNTPAVILSQDAIQEFREQSSTYSAEYGYSANQVNIVSKTGTNQLHGTVFEFFRNDSLDARNPFAASIPKLRQNQFGFTVGGPVYIPKLYDGRNKTFWFANFEAWRIKRGAILQGLVPDPAQVRGDFSNSTLPAFGTAACSAQLANNLPCIPIDPNTGQPFPGNRIDPSRFSRLAKESLALNLIPAPNGTPAQFSGNNFRTNVNLPTIFDQQTYNMDQELGRFGKVFARATTSEFTTSSLGTLSQPLGNNNFIEQELAWTVSHTINFGSTSVNNFRFGRLETKANQCGVAVSQSIVDAFGLKGTFQNLSDCARSLPGAISLPFFSGFGGPVNDTTLSYIPTWDFNDSFTTIRGRHSLTMGLNYRRWIQNRNLAADFLGTFTYRNDLVLVNGGNGANGCPTPSCGTGNGIADFLLGYYQNSGIFQPGPFSNPAVTGNLNKYHFRYFAGYFQDDWKFSPSLTLNLGLRWDLRPFPFEESNKFGWLDLSNPGGGLCVADKTLVDKGVAGVPGSIERFCGRRNPKDNSTDDFAPRIGFAWRPFGSNKTVIRGGYGIFFDSDEGREIDDSGDIFPFEVRTTLFPQSQPAASAPKLTDQLFPAFNLIQPATPDKLTFLAVIQGEQPHNPYVQQWSLSVQRELVRNTRLEVNYTGSKATHLLTRTDVAQSLRPSNPDFCSAQDANGNFTNLTKGDCPRDLRRPFKNFTGVFIDSEFQGTSNYHAANVKLEHRSSSLVVQANYTWSKSLDNKSAAAGIGNAVAGWNGFLDNHNPRLDYGRSDFDVGQRFVANFVYQLPFGRGRRFGAKVNRAADLLLGGWQVGGIATAQRGFPFSVFGQDPFGLLDTIFGTGNRVNRVGNPGFKQTPDHFLDRAAFAQPLPAHFGTSGRNIFTGPSMKTFDLNLVKNIPFNERIRMEMRLEAFNAFNRSQLGIPNSTLQSPSFGRIQGTVVDARELQLGLKILF